MSEAIERIVGAYVKLRNRKALEDLKARRCRLATELKSINGTLDLSSSIKLIEDETAVIDAGLRVKYCRSGLKCQHRRAKLFRSGAVGISVVGSLKCRRTKSDPAS